MLLKDLFKNGISFKSADLKEIRENVPGPDRGWFHLYSFNMGTGEVSDESLRDVQIFDTDLVLLLLCIKGKDNDRKAMQNDIEKVIDHFATLGKDIILRVTYDTSGHALEKEPYDIDDVLKDIDVIRDILNKKNKDVFVFQGLLVGNWGEMHTSRYTDSASLSVIYNRLIDSDYGTDSCFYAVRRPDIHMQLSNQDRRLGLFDDAILSSESDMGTYKDLEKDPEYESNIAIDAPNGGEAVYGGGYINNLSDNEVLDFLRKKKITYLNHEYDPKLLNKLKENIELFGYICSHLGYRLTVSSIRYGRHDKVLSFTVKNSGFAPIYRKTNSYIVLKDKDEKTVSLTVDLELRKKVLPDDTAVCEIAIGDDVTDGLKMPVSVFLKTERSCDSRVIRYANTQTDDGSVYLGEFR